jgi:hypothetical protein
MLMLGSSIRKCGHFSSVNGCTLFIGRASGENGSYCFCIFSGKEIKDEFVFQRRRISD